MRWMLRSEGIQAPLREILRSVMDQCQGGMATRGWPLDPLMVGQSMTGVAGVRQPESGEPRLETIEVDLPMLKKDMAVEGQVNESGGCFDVAVAVSVESGGGSGRGRELPVGRRENGRGGLSWHDALPRG